MLFGGICTHAYRQSTDSKDSIGHLHVTSVTKVETASVGALVGTVLKVDHALTSTQLLIGEVSLVLISGLGSEEWSGPFGVQVAL